MTRLWMFTILLLTGCTVGTGVPPATSPSPTSEPAGSPSVDSKPSIVRQVAEYQLPIYPTNFEFDSKGSVWVNCQGSVFEIPPGGAPQQRFTLSSGMQSIFFITEGDQYWATSSGEGAKKLGPDGAPLRDFPGPSSDWTVQPFAVDREGTVWVGHDFGSRIYKYRQDGTRLLDLDIGAMRGLKLDSQGNIVAGHTGVITWLSPAGEVLKQVKMGHNLGEFEIDANDHIWAIDQDDRGTIYHLSPDGTIETLNPVATRPSHLVLSDNGGIWFMAEHVLHRMDESGTILGTFDMAGAKGMTTLAIDPLGFLWAGYPQQTGERNFYEVARKLAIL